MDIIRVRGIVGDISSDIAKWLTKVNILLYRLMNSILNINALN